MTEAKEIELLRAALAAANREIVDWINLGNELLAHLNHDAGVNGSKFTDRPVGTLPLAPDGLYGRLLMRTTTLAPQYVRAIYEELDAAGRPVKSFK